MKSNRSHHLQVTDNQRKGKRCLLPRRNRCHIRDQRADDWWTHILERRSKDTGTDGHAHHQRLLLPLEKKTLSPDSSTFFLICLACSMGYFKSTINNEQRCEACPLNSYTKEKGATSCLCQDGFFRLNASLFQSPCIGKRKPPDWFDAIPNARLICFFFFGLSS